MNIAELISMALRYEGWQVQMAHTGSSAVNAAREHGPDAVVLDMMLPDIDGLEVLRRMRTSLPDVPVVFLTARDAVEDRIAGLTAGGDDYVTKPFSLEELVARLRGLMRRSGAQRAATSSVLVVGDLELDEDSHEVSRAGEQITLTATEFELLRFLMRNPKRVLSKAQILDRVWNYDFGGQANVVELYISYLRKKIDAGRAPMIHTMRGAGLRPQAGGLRPMRHRFASLTSRLVLTVVALVVLVAVLIGVAATAALNAQLTHQVDDDLRTPPDGLRAGRGPGSRPRRRPAGGRGRDFEQPRPRPADAARRSSPTRRRGGIRGRPGPASRGAR